MGGLQELLQQDADGGMHAAVAAAGALRWGVLQELLQQDADGGMHAAVAAAGALRWGGCRSCCSRMLMRGCMLLLLQLVH